jgi:hypothetical protein
VFNRGDGTDTVLDDATTTTSSSVDSWRDDDGDGINELHHDLVTTTTHPDGGRDTLLFGPGIAVSDVAVLFSADGKNLIVGVRDAAHPGRAATPPEIATSIVAFLPAFLANERTAHNARINQIACIRQHCA